jgi:outer membrane biosynthesis protein TonB
MSDFWKQWENQVIDGRFPLRRFLSASTHSAVFLTEYATPSIAAAIKFIRADAPFADLQLARWQAAAALSHPHLVRLLGWGQCRLGSHELLFVVMEYAEQSLAQILVHRALTFDEVREMMRPTLDALCFIHRSGWVHGQVKPSNVCVVDDVLKLAGDVLRPAGESSVGTTEFSPYDAPEETAGSSSSAGDVWGLGMTVVAALTRYPVARRHERSQIVLPPSVTPAFAAAIRQCLSIDPGRRPTAAGLEAQLAAPAPSAALNPSAPAPELPVKAEAARVDARTSRNKIPTAFILVGIAVLATVVWSGVHLMRARARLAQPAPAAEISGAASAAAATAGAGAAGAGAAGGRAGAAGTQAPPRVAAAPVSPPAAVTAGRTGPVLHEEMPRVSRTALATIHGRIKVEVRVAVNDAGNVSAATLRDAGPSSYFARMASDAAKAWRFAPAPASQSRRWLLQFEFTRSGVKANAAALP